MVASRVVHASHRRSSGMSSITLSSQRCLPSSANIANTAEVIAFVAEPIAKLVDSSGLASFEHTVAFREHQRAAPDDRDTAACGVPVVCRPVDVPVKCRKIRQPLCGNWLCRAERNNRSEARTRPPVALRRDGATPPMLDLHDGIQCPLAMVGLLMRSISGNGKHFRLPYVPPY